MIGRVVAWVVLSVVVVVGYQAYRHWSSPWNITASPVLSQLPPAATGCGEKCK